eukprot:5917965-Amphidinium_carterae.2
MADDCVPWHWFSTVRRGELYAHWSVNNEAVVPLANVSDHCQLRVAATYVQLRAVSACLGV